MGIEGVGERSVEDLRTELKAGGRFVVYSFTVSLLVLTLRQSSSIRYIPPGENAVGPGLDWSALTFVAGWWGIPWGPIYTIQAIGTNFAGGKDVTREVIAALPELRGMHLDPEALARRIVRRASLRKVGTRSIDVALLANGDVQFIAQGPDAQDPFGNVIERQLLTVPASAVPTLRAAMSVAEDLEVLDAVQRQADAIQTAGGEVRWLRGIGVEPVTSGWI